jgi:hypothetical protein
LAPEPFRALWEKRKISGPTGIQTSDCPFRSLVILMITLHQKHANTPNFIAMLFQGLKAMLINTIVSMMFFKSNASFRSALGDALW